MPDASPQQEFQRRMAEGDASLRLYAILDAQSCDRRGIDLLELARAWHRAGVALVQFRDKASSRELIQRRAREVRRSLPQAILLLNDYVDLVASTGFDGVHVGQTDTAISEARRRLGPERIVGMSTHSAEEARSAAQSDVDYIAIGPVYPTSTKQNAEPVVGLDGVRAARAAIRQPLVAIGGIAPEQVDEVRRAGADTVALISGLLPLGNGAQIFTRHAQDILARLK